MNIQMSDMNSINCDQTEGLAETIARAQQGDRTSMGQLAERAEARLLTYLYRLTLNYDLSQDLCQQTLVKMVQSLATLERIDRFWCWLLRHAMGEAQHYFRDQQREHRAEIKALNQAHFQQYVAQNQHDGLNEAARLELSDIIYEAIAQMRFAYRNVLVLRCYEGLSFAEIAEFMGCKELRARVLFFRAKHALKHHLARKGFGKETLLTGLSLFGILTVPTEAASAACSVKAASLQIGFLGTLAGSVGTNMGVFLAAAATAVLAGITSERIALSLAIIGVVIAGLIFATCYQILTEG